MNRIRRTIATFTVTLLLFSAACTNRPATRVTLTPEQKFALVKAGAQGAVVGLALRIASLEQDEEANSAKIKFLKEAKGILEEFNNQIADVAMIDRHNRDDVRKVIDKSLAGADNLTKGDVLQLSPEIQADIQAVIAGVKAAIQAFYAFIPNDQPAQ
jgi:hypothetical protein